MHVQMSSAFSAPVINDVATRQGYDLLFPLSPSIGPVPEGRCGARTEHKKSGKQPTVFYRQRPFNKFTASQLCRAQSLGMQMVFGFRPIIEKTWGDKLAPFKFPASFEMGASFDASVDAASKMGWQVKHVDRCVHAFVGQSVHKSVAPLFVIDKLHHPSFGHNPLVEIQVSEQAQTLLHCSHCHLNKCIVVDKHHPLNTKLKSGPVGHRTDCDLPWCMDGHRDDIVIKLSQQDDAVMLNMRSRSRIGKGVCVCERIREGDLQFQAMLSMNRETGSEGAVEQGFPTSMLTSASTAGLECAPDIVAHSSISEYHIHLCKVKPRNGVLGHACADALALQAANTPDMADTTLNQA
eukprot:1161444-Pelagomonas_calceolata.AAC.4